MLSRRLLRIKTIKALYAHFKSEQESVAASEKTLARSVDKCYELYHQLLWLVVDVAAYARKRIELNRGKKLPTAEDLNPNMRFVDNRVVAQIAGSGRLVDYLEKHSLGWATHAELVKGMYNAMVGADYYAAYMSRPQASYRDDQRLVRDFFVETVQDNPQLEEAIEEQSILWADDVDFALILAVKTVDECRAAQSELPLSPQFKSADDETFYKELFRKAAVDFNHYLAYVEEFTQNWDVDRIAFMDNVIMVAAMAEMVGFPSIPVRVTLDEYIEISKYYSTPASSQFINGILDKAIVKLTDEGLIKKTGRGLL